MELAQGIRKIGFRRWYERQLIESHAYLVSGLLALVLAFAGVEGLSLRAPGWGPFLLALLILVSGALATWAITRYLVMLTHTLRVGERSTCKQCATYGILEIPDAGAERGEPSGGAARGALRVRCRKCGHEWTIE